MSKISTFFSNYLINKKTQYIWKNFVSPTFRADVDIVRNAKIRLYFIFIFIFLFFSVYSIFKTRFRDQWDVTGHGHMVT